jgi:hypothetical protein
MKLDYLMTYRAELKLAVDVGQGPLGGAGDLRRNGRDVRRPEAALDDTGQWPRLAPDRLRRHGPPGRALDGCD